MPGTRNKRWGTKGVGEGSYRTKAVWQVRTKWDETQSDSKTEKVDGQEVKQRAAELNASQTLSFKRQRKILDEQRCLQWGVRGKSTPPLPHSTAPPFMLQVSPETWESNTKTATAEEVRRAMFSQTYSLVGQLLVSERFDSFLFQTITDYQITSLSSTGQRKASRIQGVNVLSSI